MEFVGYSNPCHPRSDGVLDKSDYTLNSYGILYLEFERHRIWKYPIVAVVRRMQQTF